MVINDGNRNLSQKQLMHDIKCQSNIKLINKVLKID